MKNKKGKFLLSMFLILGLFSLGLVIPDKEDKDKNKLSKPTTNDNNTYIAINNCLMWISNNGMGSHDPRTDASGFYWPGGENATISAIFADGLIWGAKIGNEIRVNGATYRYGLQAGRILDNGVADDPGLSKYRVYKIRKDWETLAPGSAKDQYEKDYNEWPVEDGAPWVDKDGDGVFTRGVDEPQFAGDEVLWCVSNDMDPGRSTYTYGTLPMGLEVQTTVFGFNRTGDLGDMLFKKYKVINKGQNTLRDMVFGYWSDTDLGFANDDYSGCDTAIKLGYTWNGDNDDETYYGAAPPANGYVFFQGPIVPANPTDSAKFLGTYRHGYRNLPMTAFTIFINNVAPYYDPDLGVASGSVQFYNLLTGKLGDGSPFIDPNGDTVSIILTGDPVGRTGWYEGAGWPGGPAAYDRRHTMGSGPFTMAPGDTQEIVVGILIGRSSDNIQSIRELKRKVGAAQIAYDLDFDLTPSPPTPTGHSVTGDKEITLWWETNAEGYDEGDPLIYGRGFSDTTYTFEGYRIWQHRNLTDQDPILLGIIDVNNDITEVTQTKTIGTITFQEVMFTLPNEGISRYFKIDEDKITGGQLLNANPYYFSITAFGYSLNSDPKILESTKQIMEVFPGRPPINAAYELNAGDDLFFNHTEGNGDGSVYIKVVDPNILTGHQYEVILPTPTTYSLIDKTENDTLLRNQTNFGVDSLRKDIIDGFVLMVDNEGADQLGTAQAKIRYLREVKGPGGVDVAPADVYQTYNSTGQWRIYSVNVNNQEETSDLQGLQYLTGSFGLDEFEIRFTTPETGSEYYTSGYANIGPLQKVDPKGKGKVPFEVWRIAPDGTQERLMIKTWDKALRDTAWTQHPDSSWESFYAFIPLIPYVEPIPPTSDATTGGTVAAQYRVGNLKIKGSIPAPGTVLRFTLWRPLDTDDKFSAVVTAPNTTTEVAKNNIDKISVFPNPYFGTHSLETNKYERFVRFTGLPNEATIRIVSLSGVFIKKLDKSDPSQYIDWDLKNKDGLPVASGMYIAYIDIPNVGTKTLKLAIIMETQFLDRI